MNCTRLLLLAVAFLQASLLSAQLQLTLKPMPAPNTWGVYVTACEDIAPSNNTITGSGQITVVFPAGMLFSNLTGVAGTWAQNATAQSPIEAPGSVYVSLGFIADNPHITYQPGYETLLLTFKLTGNGSGTPSLIQNGVDPFDQQPNSFNSNPGNELSVVDFGIIPVPIYEYTGNYSGNPVNCSGGTDDPDDPTVIDTTGTVDSTTVIDTTIIDTTSNTDTSVIDTTGNVDTTTIIDTTNIDDTTVIDTTSQIDTTENTDTSQTSGVFDQTVKQQIFLLYPNPTYEWITVEFLVPNNEAGIVRLWTLDGMPLREFKRGGSDSLFLNLGELSPGLYYFTFEIDGKIVQQERFVRL